MIRYVNFTEGFVRVNQFCYPSNNFYTTFTLFISIYYELQ